VAGSGTQRLHEPPLLADLRDDPVGGVRGRGRPHVGDVVDEGRVRLVADRGDHRRAARGDGAHQPLVGERQEVLDRAAAPRDHDDLDLGIGVQPPESLDH
jgi:hypothetical protein